MSSAESVSYQLLPPLDRARLFEHLIQNKGMSATSLARAIKKSLSYVSNTIRLLKLPPLVQDGLATNAISEGHARALLAVTDPAAILAIYKQILVEKKTVRDVERLVRISKK